MCFARPRFEMDHYVFAVTVLLLFSMHQVNGRHLKGEPPSGTNGTEIDRSGKFLSLFSIVRFANSLCVGTNLYNGTCLTSAECAGVTGGTASGSCASGFGVCCTIFASSCGTTITRNNTYWVQPGFSTSNTSYTTDGQCSVYVQKCNSNICQIRLDFETFDIADPDATAGTATAGTATQCLTDVFVVSGQTNNVPGICGYNQGQHMYLDMTPGSSQFTLSMLLSGTTTNRYWNIRISQIPCGTSYTAPQDCLQWFTDASGTFRSFNYVYEATPAVQHLANQDYTICIRTAQGFCGICYSVCDSGAAAGSQFLISASTPAETQLGTDCATDFIQIPCAVATQSGTTAACASIICGGFFSSTATDTAHAAVYSYRKPFEVRFYTNSFDETTGEGIGFCLKYQQLPCVNG